ncbi:MAG: hypothetical protein LBH96_03285 [Candidatus Peribacteria bacterium]|jgi:hypothetical protein|nr:hypothetical protein [Candidatus Peribacteria bacterium]
MYKKKRFYLYIREIMIQEQHSRVFTADGVELGVLKYVPEKAKGQIFMLH